jgi:tetratricopeptide (TPR) repeat protein
MKFKPIYLYIIFIVIAVIALIIFSGRGNKEPASVVSGDNIKDKQMPSDEIHKNLQNPVNPPPSKDNVSESFKHELSALQKEVEENPNDTLKVRKYADLLAAAHKQDESIPYYEKILKKYPRRADVLFSLSFIYFNKGDFAKAEDATMKILLFDKNNAQAQYNLGAIAASKGDSPKAKQIWTKLINENTSSELTSLAKESLTKLK